MDKNTFVLSIVLIGAFLSGCTPQYVYREPNDAEVNSFVPYGYQLVSRNDNSPAQIVKANLDADPAQEILLPMYGLDWESPVKILTIKFDAKTNEWNLLETLEYGGFAYIGVIGSPTDLDADGINEVHLVLTPFDPTGFTNGHSILVLTNRFLQTEMAKWLI